MLYLSLTIPISLLIYQYPTHSKEIALTGHIEASALPKRDTTPEERGTPQSAKYRIRLKCDHRQ